MHSYLDTVLEAVELYHAHVSLNVSHAPASPSLCPETVSSLALHMDVLTSQQLLAIWQPAWPTTHVQSQ